MTRTACPIMASTDGRLDSEDHDQLFHPLIATWMLRMLLGRNETFRKFFSPETGFSDADMAAFLGLEAHASSHLKPEEMRDIMRNRLADLEQGASIPFHLRRNLEFLSRPLALSPMDCQILAFALLLERYNPLSECLNMTPRNTKTQLQQTLALAFNETPHAIRGSLSPHGTLRQAGLLKLERCLGLSLELMDELKEALLAENRSEKDLLQHFLALAPEPALAPEHYPHVRKDVDIIQRLLAASIEHKDKGVNILLYGPPGTGKTELARLLGRQLKVSLFEVKTEDGDGDPEGGYGRLVGYRLSQQILANGRNIIVFDEVEDIFPARAYSFLGIEQKSAQNKGWINRALEENPVPTIWICNQIAHIDPAFLRRFDYALELTTPPRSVRLGIIRERLADTPVSEAFLNRLAEHPQLSPAQIAKAARAVHRLEVNSRAEAEAIVERILDRGIRAMGQQPLEKDISGNTRYSLDFLNVNADIPAMIEGLKRGRRGNICFYGPPGTGKSALARRIAETLDRPLLARRASDILSAWLGATEQNIAAMFRDAADEDAVLLLDEADSFLRDRRGAEHSWEVTQVNELLVQMERFQGLFICSTNLVDDLDQASLRRFALKVRFDYLTPDQAWAMLQAEAANHPTEADRRAIMGMRELTPGDFAAVKKRLAILGLEPTAAELIEGLREDKSVRQVAGQGGIGFLS